MIGDILQPTHLLFILVIALLVLGPKRLPEVGRSLGRGMRDFRNALSSDDHPDEVEAGTSTPTEYNPPEPAAVPDPPPAPEPPAPPGPLAPPEPAATQELDAAQQPTAEPEPAPEPAKPLG